MKKRVIYLLVGIILALISFIYDVQMIQFVESIRNFYLDYIFVGITFASSGIIIFFFLTSLFLWQEHKRKWIPPLWLSLGFSIIMSYIIKVLVHRARPFQEGIVSVLGIGQYFMQNNVLTWNFSMPSFQSILVFSALPILDKEFPKFKYIWFVFACLVAFSRVYFGLHYFSDVIIGGIVGYSIGLYFVYIEEKYGLGSKILRKLKIEK